MENSARQSENGEYPPDYAEVSLKMVELRLEAEHLEDRNPQYKVECYAEHLLSRPDYKQIMLVGNYSVRASLDAPSHSYAHDESGPFPTEFMATWLSDHGSSIVDASSGWTISVSVTLPQIEKVGTLLREEFEEEFQQQHWHTRMRFYPRPFLPDLAEAKEAFRNAGSPRDKTIVPPGLHNTRASADQLPTDELLPVEGDPREPGVFTV